MEDKDIESKLEDSLKEIPIKKIVKKKSSSKKKNKSLPNKLFLLPMTRRPFFPGMAAPLVIEPGVYYEILKEVAKSDEKILGLFLTKNEAVDIYNMDVSELCDVGIAARILRIIPLEEGGGAQVVLNMEKRIKIKKKILFKYY